MKNSSKIIIALTSIAAVGGGVYLFTRKKDQAPATSTDKGNSAQFVASNPNIKDTAASFTGNALVDSAIGGVFDAIGIDPVFTPTEPVVPVGGGRPLPAPLPIADVIFNPSPVNTPDPVRLPDVTTGSSVQSSPVSGLIDEPSSDRGLTGVPQLDRSLIDGFY